MFLILPPNRGGNPSGLASTTETRKRPRNKGESLAAPSPKPQLAPGKKRIGQSKKKF